MKIWRWNGECSAILNRMDQDGGLFAKRYCAARMVEVMNAGSRDVQVIRRVKGS